jgi:hypothetical protein
MIEEIERQLHEAVNADEVRRVLLAACAEHGKVTGTGVTYTNATHSPRQVTCFVEMEDKVAGTVAENLGTLNLGTRLVVFRYEAPETFQTERS